MGSARRAPRPEPRTLDAPRGSITTPEIGIPVVARVEWEDNAVTEVPATVTAWTRKAVRITWEIRGEGLRSDWVPADHVRRGFGQGDMRLAPSADGT